MRPSSRRVAVAFLVCLVAGAACSRYASRGSRVVRLGHHRVRLTPLPGWEHLDHGRQQLFRLGQAEIALEDLGPATPQGLGTELRDAERLWLTGRRNDAMARIRTLHGPPIALLPQLQRADFWKPWTDITYVPELADSASLGRAFDQLIRQTDALPDISMERLVEYELKGTRVGYRREVSRKDELEIHGARWTSIETWDRVSHLVRNRLAFANVGGYLVRLETRRGRFEQTAPAFDSLLATIEVLPER